MLATVDKLAGDYVQDGEQLGLTYDRSRFGFVLDVPVTQLRYVHTGQRCRIFLPDGRVLNGRVAEVLATADVSIQTQRYTIRPGGPGARTARKPGRAGRNRQNRAAPGQHPAARRRADR